jgi:hypothetical protein
MVGDKGVILQLNDGGGSGVAGSGGGGGGVDGGGGRGGGIDGGGGGGRDGGGGGAALQSAGSVWGSTSIMVEAARGPETPVHPGVKGSAGNKGVSERSSPIQRLEPLPGGVHSKSWVSQPPPTCPDERGERDGEGAKVGHGGACEGVQVGRRRDAPQDISLGARADGDGGTIVSSWRIEREDAGARHVDGAEEAEDGGRGRGRAARAQVERLARRERGDGGTSAGARERRSQVGAATGG